MNNFLRSSTGTGVKMRIKAFTALIIPIVNNLLESQGINILPEAVDMWIDSLFVVIFGVLEIYGWVRAKIR